MENYNTSDEAALIQSTKLFFVDWYVGWVELRDTQHGSVNLGFNKVSQDKHNIPLEHCC